jgi:hypothetical protein
MSDHSSSPPSSNKKIAPENFIFGLNALLHVFILTAFLVIFYQVVVTKLETDAIKNELTRTLNKSLPQMFAEIDDQDNTLKSFLRNLQQTNILDKFETLYAKPDPSTTSWNSWLFLAAYGVVGGLFLVVLTVVVVTWLFDIDIKLAALLRENATLFIAIGIVELVFFLTIALKYAPAPPSYLTQEVANAIKRL